MQQFNPKEKLLLLLLFLVSRSNLTLLRELMKRFSSEPLSSQDVIYGIPEILHRLEDQKIVCNDRYYTCGKWFSLPILKELLTVPELPELLAFCEKKEPFEFGHSDRELLNCNVKNGACAIGILTGNFAVICRISSTFHGYDWNRWAHQEASELIPDTVRRIFRLPWFDLSLIHPDTRFLFFPSCLLGSLQTEIPFENWRDFCTGGLPGRDIFQYVVPSFLMAAFLSNDRELLAQLMQSVSPENRILGEGCQFLLGGNWTEADKKFTRYLNALRLKDKTGDAGTILIVLFASIAACLAKAASSRLNRWMEYLVSCSYGEWTGWISLLDAIVKKQTYYPEDLRESAPLEKMLAIPAYSREPQAVLTQEQIQIYEDAGQVFLKNGWTVPGIYLLNGLGTMLPADDSRREEIIRQTAESKIVPFLPMEVRRELWEHALEALETACMESLHPAKAVSKQGVIGWNLKTMEVKDERRTVRRILTCITPLFFPVKKNGSLGPAKEISVKTLRKDTYAVLLSPEESRITDAVNDSYCDNRLENKCVNFLTASEHVFIDGASRPVRLIMERNQIISRKKADGSIELSPKYCRTQDRFLRFEDQYFLDCSEEGICRVCMIAEDDPVDRFFLSREDELMKLTIPASGESKAAAFAERIADAVPVTGILASAAYKDLPHAEGQLELHVLLTRESGQLRMDFRNKPLAEEFFFKPGEGPSDQLLSLPSGQIVLHRDLKAETDCFQKRIAQCPVFSDCGQTGYRFVFEDPAEILQALGELKSAGILFDWKKGTPLKISVPKSADHLTLHGGTFSSDWFSIGGEIPVSDGEILSLQELLQKLDDRIGTFIRLDEDSYLQLTDGLLKQSEALKAASSMEKEEIRIVPAALPMLSSVFETGLPEQLQQQMDRIRAAFSAEISLPRGFAGTLRPYQEDGFRYLSRMADCRIGCCLADEMGLGKTIQLLALLLREASQGPALVVCPASLCWNWEKEARRFAPSLRVQILSQTDRESVIRQAGKGELILCSYGILQTESELLSGKKWHTLILDEAQAIKNHTVKRAKNVRNLQSDIRIAATGTPMENHLIELWSIFDFLNPGLLGSVSGFEKRFCRNGKSTPALRRLVSPLIMRRKKSDVLEELPPKTEITIPVELSEEERVLYEKLRRAALSELEGADSRMTVLAHLTKLRRCCCHPSLAEPGIPIRGAKLQRLLELAGELRESGHRALIFSQYVDFLSLLSQELRRREVPYQYIDGATPQKKRKEAVVSFQSGNGDFFLISLKAGGTGLNLTAADYVILADPWWNPAVEDQAADRVHRIGQVHPVTVCRLITSETVEEKVMDLHSRKRETSMQLLEDAECSGISFEELMLLFEK